MPTKTKRKPLSDAEREAKAEKHKAEVDALHAQIAAKVDTLAQGDEWLAYLKFMSGFHTYSFNNVILMWCQRSNPAPSLVAGYRQWQAKGYQVRGGEKGMRIFAFSRKLLRDRETGEPLLDENGKQRYIVKFPVVSVFDVSQCDATEDAEPLNTHDPELLTGEDVLGLRDRVAKFVHDRGWQFVVEPVNGGANGYTTLD